ncbi:DNA polymerase Y family protein [Rhodococcus sp. Z13]|uniref:DNA polymerase Y family protein n=1 Tax=Rhodococcus sacchari TaxID=2962047 RepID=A0ACD4DD68_9NOCA|nr:DNA polymerase Y family protein [Rhodococcus sp. Z13]UYP17947.1 DNA polymerase Y family protein [Rhodococcus sp. Z13]
MNARTPARVLALWCPDWPAVAAATEAGLDVTVPIAVFSADRVLACSATARTLGVRRGLRRREAQARCPELHVTRADPDRDARAFEPVVAAIEALAPGVEILRPGLVVLPARGVVRWFGSEETAAETLIDAVAATGVECRIGVADELSTAVLAARHDALVPVGEGAGFLAPLPVSDLAVEPVLAAPERVGTVDLLRRLGIRTIGAFAALSASDVASRFGPDVIAAHRSARALPERPPSRRSIPPELRVELPCDPPVERVDAAAFAGRTLADLLHARLAAAGVACTRLLVTARTEAGEEHARTWRCAEPLTPEGTADRVRWQLDGWLTGRNANRPTAGIIRLSLEPVEVVAAGALQLGLWGGVGDADERARRALVRVQGLLGNEAVCIGVPNGGRGPSERIVLVPVGDEAVPHSDPDAPWPGRLPPPAPALVLHTPPAIRLDDDVGEPVTVTERGLLSGSPARLRWGSRGWTVTGWAGPWPVDECWWDPASARCAARLQVRLGEARALLVLFGADGWRVEGIYD